MGEKGENKGTIESHERERECSVVEYRLVEQKERKKRYMVVFEKRVGIIGSKRKGNKKDNSKNGCCGSKILRCQWRTVLLWEEGLGWVESCFCSDKRKEWGEAGGDCALSQKAVFNCGCLCRSENGRS